MDRIDPAYFNYAEISKLCENLFFVNQKNRLLTGGFASYFHVKQGQPQGWGGLCPISFQILF